MAAAERLEVASEVTQVKLTATLLSASLVRDSSEGDWFKEWQAVTMSPAEIDEISLKESPNSGIITSVTFNLELPRKNFCNCQS